MKDLQLEEELIYRYNGKKISEMPPFFQKLLKEHFHREDGILDFSKFDSYSKGRIVITCFEKRMFLSVKSSPKFSIHKESLRFFLSFLEDLNLHFKTKELIKEQLFCFSREEKEFFIGKNQPYLKEAKTDLDRFKDTYLYRFLFKGAKESNPIIDALYFEDNDVRFLLPKEQIQKHPFTKKDSQLTFSFFTYELDKEAKDVRFYWKSLKEDGMAILRENQ